MATLTSLDLFLAQTTYVLINRRGKKNGQKLKRIQKRSNKSIQN